MGHSGSVHRDRRNHGGGGGGLYGESTEPMENTRRYTPAQMQAMYLSRGRPDTGFMTNQQANISREIPEMQQTVTVKNHVNLKKTSLKLVPMTEEEEKNKQYNLEFSFDATKPCRLFVYLLALEKIDDETGCSSYSLANRISSKMFTRNFQQGLGQYFNLKEQLDEMLDLSLLKDSQLIYPNDDSYAFPLVIVLEVTDPNAKSPQSQATFATFIKKKQQQDDQTSKWTLKMLKQKIQVDGLTYELQEIYGMDGSVAAAPSKDDTTSQTKQSKDEIDLPDGAECIICMCEPRNTTVLPCRHMCLCGECAEALRKNQSTCPICRTKVESLLQIRVDTKNTPPTSERRYNDDDEKDSKDSKDSK